MGDVLNNRRELSEARIEKLRQKLGLAKDLCADHACVYATGSYGRVEASRFSDLDLSILSQEIAKGTPEKPRYEASLGNLKQISVKAELIRAIHDLGIEEFSGDGEYLTHYTVVLGIDGRDRLAGFAEKRRHFHTNSVNAQAL